MAVAYSAQIPRRSDWGFAAMDEWLLQQYRLLQFPRAGRNPGYKMSIVQSTLDCSLVPTVVLYQYASITVLMTST